MVSATFFADFQDLGTPGTIEEYPLGAGYKIVLSDWTTTLLNPWNWTRLKTYIGANNAELDAFIPIGVKQIATVTQQSGTTGIEAFYELHGGVYSWFYGVEGGTPRNIWTTGADGEVFTIADSPYPIETGCRIHATGSTQYTFDTSFVLTANPNRRLFVERVNLYNICDGNA